MNKPWIGVDLDGTLATYTKWVSPEDVGEPIKPMVDRVKKWLEDGIYDVRIFTARVSHPDQEAISRKAIREFLVKAGLPEDLEVTCVKDYHMVELWDDRAVTVEFNTGKALAPSAMGIN